MNQKILEKGGIVISVGAGVVVVFCSYEQNQHRNVESGKRDERKLVVSLVWGKSPEINKKR